jgi:hypothetical protein
MRHDRNNVVQVMIEFLYHQANTGTVATRADEQPPRSFADLFETALNIGSFAARGCTQSYYRSNMSGVQDQSAINVGSRATPDFAQRPNTNITTLLYLRLLSYTTTLYTKNILAFYLNRPLRTICTI